VKSPLRVVAIGGGTGLSTLLSGLKRHARATPPSTLATKPPLDIAAIVTVTDDGGSSGRLRRDFDILPPGDIRNCMTALSEDTALLSQLFQYRFASGRGLKGHSFGNLFLTAMHQITGDFSQAVRLSSEILAIRGRIFPATSANVVLRAALKDGTIVRGESKISKSRKPIDSISIEPDDCDPLPETLEALAQADLITLGPGSLYTSVIPNLLVRGVSEAIAASSALKAYFVNLMWQPGETTNFRASDHVKAILRHCGKARNLLDVCVVNTGSLPEKLLNPYQAKSAQPVENDTDNLRALGVEVLSTDLLRMSRARAGEKIRHDPGSIGAVTLELAQRGRRRKRKLKV